MSLGSFVDPVLFEVSVVGDQAIAKFKEMNGQLDQLDAKATAAGGGLSSLDRAGHIASAALMVTAAAAVTVEHATLSQ